MDKHEFRVHVYDHCFFEAVLLLKSSRFADQQKSGDGQTGA